MRNPLPFLAVQAAAIAAFPRCFRFGVSPLWAVAALTVPAPLALVALLRSRGPCDPVLMTVLAAAEVLVSGAALLYLLLVLALYLEGPPTW